MRWTDLKEAQSLALWLNWLGIGSCTCPYAFQQLGRLYGVSMGPGWVRLETTPGCGEHDENEKKTKDTEMTTTPTTTPRAGLLCSATYDEPQRADRSDTHTCALDDEHVGPHFCDLCGSWWLARVGVVPGVQKDREQIALARMDAHLLGTGWVMVTPGKDGGYDYDRIDPVRVSLEAESAEAVDVDVEEAVLKAATRSIAAHRIGEKLRLLVRRSELRGDKMRGWVSTGQLKDLLEESENVRPGAGAKKKKKNGKNG